MTGIKRSAQSVKPDAFQTLCKAKRLPVPEREVTFDAERRFRFDYAWGPWMVALEVNGGVWSRGRHSRGAGQISDMAKLNLAQTKGWIVLQCTPQQLGTEPMIDTIRTALVLRGNKVA